MSCSLVASLVLHAWLLIAYASSNTDGPEYDKCNTDEAVTITGTAGSLIEPQNQSFYDPFTIRTCKWVIEDHTNRDVVFFNISELSFPEGVCSYVTIKDNNAASYSEWVNSCESIYDSTLIRTSSNSAFVTFSSAATDSSETNLAISWWFQDVCSGGPYYIDDADIRAFSSTPAPWYEGRKNCSYNLTADTGYIRITIVKFETVSSSCKTGYLEIANALDPTEIWFKFCRPQRDKSVWGAGVSALVTHYQTADNSSFEITIEDSTVKGLTKAQREGVIIGSSLGGAVVILLIITSCVVVKKKNRMMKQSNAVGLQAGGMHHRQMLDTDIESPSHRGSPHIMISYQWDVQKQVLQFKERLSQAGFRVWIDVEQMHKATDTFDAMAHAVDNAAIVIPVLTSKYQDSVNCRKEIQYADKAGKPIVPIRLEKKFKPSRWLGFLLGNTLWHDFSNPETFEESFNKFFHAIRENGEAAFRTEFKEGSDYSDEEDEAGDEADSSAKAI